VRTIFRKLDLDGAHDDHRRVLAVLRTYAPSPSSTRQPGSARRLDRARPGSRPAAAATVAPGGRTAALVFPGGADAAVDVDHRARGEVQRPSGLGTVRAGGERELLGLGAPRPAGVVLQRLERAQAGAAVGLVDPQTGPAGLHGQRPQGRQRRRTASASRAASIVLTRESAPQADSRSSICSSVRAKFTKPPPDAPWLAVR